MSAFDTEQPGDQEPAASTADLRSDIKATINRHSAENGSDTPDHVLAEYLVDCLAAFDKATIGRDQWYDHKPWHKEDDKP